MVSRAFTLELYYEQPGTGEFAESVKDDLLRLVGALAPHINLTVHVLPATGIIRSRFFDAQGAFRDVPNQPATIPERQSLLITSEEIGASGWAGPGSGCVSKGAILRKRHNRGDSADITIHEWLHTLQGQHIGVRSLPSPHNNGAYPEYGSPSGHSLDGDQTWHAWYRFLLRSTDTL